MKLKTKFEDSDFSFGEIVNARIGTVEEYLIVAVGTKDGNSVEFHFKTIKEFLKYFGDASKERETWAEAVKVKELPSGLKIADRDYYEIDENGEKKIEFTWDEAMKRFKDDPNWRLPTPKELNQMVLDLGYTDEGVFDGVLFAQNLGYQDEWSGSYWSSFESSTPDAPSTTDARGLYFTGGYLGPQLYYAKDYEFAVRCVRRSTND